MLTIQQKEARKRGIGGSDIAVIAGLSPWKTAAQLWMEKALDMSFEPDPQAEERMAWGNALEPLIADMAAERYGWKVRRSNRHFKHKKHTFLQGNIDRYMIDDNGQRGILEIKTSSQFNYTEWSNNGPPLYYMTQIQHYMLITGLKYAYIVCLFGGQRMEKFGPFYAEPEAQQWIIQIASDFWKLVEEKTPPPFDYKADSVAIEALWPQAEAGKVVYLSELLDVAEKYDSFREQGVLVAHDKTASANEIKAAMGDAETAVIGEYVATWKARKDGKRVFNLKRKGDNGIESEG